MKARLGITSAGIICTVAATMATNAGQTKINDSELERKVEQTLGQMTTAEKVAIIHAQSKFSSPGVPRLGIPELWCTDGPHGIRPEVKWDEWDQAGWTNDSCVAFPALTCLAATWNPDMALLYGKSIGEEAIYRGKDVLLGPGVNINRTPLNGRNFEYMGEDPCLSSIMVVPYIKGLQNNGVAACVKHFALNNQELHRTRINVNVDDRTLYEIYLPAFKAAVQDGGAWSIMGAYNLYNNEHLCHNKRMLVDILKKEWGFDGAVISDWGGTHDTQQAIDNGLDLEMGTSTNGLNEGTRNAYDNYYLATPYFRLLTEGKADTAVLNDKARRVLRLMYRTSMRPGKGNGALCSEAHYDVARKIGREGIVLLKNENAVLPVNGSKGKRILVVGENAIKMMTVGGGSSSLKVQREISPLDGIKEAAKAKGYDVDYARGYAGSISNEYNGVVTGQDLKETRSAQELIAEAVGKAKDADYVIFFGGLNKDDHQDSEGSDRIQLGLPYGQDEVIEELAKANPNFVVVNISGNAVAMPWIKNVPAVMQGWFIGSEAGHSLADVIFGDVNPSGKLPMTFPVRLEDVGAHAIGEYPGTKRENENVWDQTYNEGLLVGYRWFDTKGIKPLFPFGHGLSYTTFEYGKPTASATKMLPDGTIEISIPVTNTGSVKGSEIVQLYVSDVKAPVLRPAKELKGFDKIALNPGETRNVKFTVRESDLAYFDADRHQWTTHPGKYIIRIGASSGDIRHSIPFTLEYKDKK